MDFQLNLASESVARTHPEAPLIVSPSLSVREVQEVMQSNRHGWVMVWAADHRLRGNFTGRDRYPSLARFSRHFPRC